MKLMHNSLFFLVFSLTLSSQIGLGQAQSYPNLKTWQISQKFKPRVDNKRNPVTDGGATRGKSCLTKKELLIPLTPLNLVGLTVAKHPTFFWNMSDSTAEFLNFTILADGETENLYESKLPIPNEAGIISFTLPENAPELEINRTYKWSINVVCDLEDSSANIRMSGWVQRIEPDASLLQNLKNADSRNLSNVYGEAGIWYEGLNAIIQQRCTQPNNLTVKIKWRQFLESAGLNDLISNKLINSCLVNNK
jgi:Domain of Unknown Function (DUF928)